MCTARSSPYKGGLSPGGCLCQRNEFAKIVKFYLVKYQEVYGYMEMTRGGGVIDTWSCCRVVTFLHLNIDFSETELYRI